MKLRPPNVSTGQGLSGVRKYVPVLGATTRPSKSGSVALAWAAR
jgi:hypothetical protein